jgi:hypothetical protein
MAKHYESEITQFLNQYKQQHAGTEQRQREGRARLWDKPIDQELQDGFRAGRIAQQPYVYQTD